MEFNNNNLITFYIKSFLKEFNLPMISVWKPGYKSYKDALYIHKNVIAKCLNTGDWDEFTVDNFKVIYDNFHWNKRYDNITKNLRVNNLIYDSYTHEYLGDYLRFLRDYRGIDLMSLYNCFSNREVTDISIPYTTTELINGVETTVYKTFTNDSGSRIYMVDIIPFTEYTIFMDSLGTVEFISGYYNNGFIDPFDTLGDESSSYIFPYGSTLFTAKNLSFNKPIVYNKMSKENLTSEVWENISNSITYNQRKNLKLFIKVPYSQTPSSLVVLEGIHTENSIYHFNENHDLDLIDKIVALPYIKNGNIDIPGDKYEFNSKKRTQLSKLGLTKLQTGINHPFSDRLIEYLIGNAIVPFDKIENNISRVQDILHKGVKSKINYTENVRVYLEKINLRGEWDTNMTNTILGIAKIKNLNNIKYDILGYVDKDIELAISLEDI